MYSDPWAVYCRDEHGNHLAWKIPRFLARGIAPIARLIGSSCVISRGFDPPRLESLDAVTGQESLAAAEGRARAHTRAGERMSARACVSPSFSSFLVSSPVLTVSSRADFPRARARNHVNARRDETRSRRRTQAARCPTTDAGHHISIARDDFAAHSCVRHAGTIDGHARTAVTAICIRCYLRKTTSCERFTSTRENRTSRKMVPAG